MRVGHDDSQEEFQGFCRILGRNTEVFEESTGGSNRDCNSSEVECREWSQLNLLTDRQPVQHSNCELKSLLEKENSADDESIREMQLKLNGLCA
jgi:hypothetical protein